MKKVLKFKINLKKSKIRKFVKVPQNILKKGHIEKWHSLFYDFDKVKDKIIFRFELDEENKTLQSIDHYPKEWHGIFKKENIKFNEEFSSINENLYSCRTSKWWRPEPDNTTELYRYIVTISSAWGGLKLTAEVYLAHPHKIGNDPKFKLFDTFEIVMDCVDNISSDKVLLRGLDKKFINKILSKKSMNDAIKILKNDPKKPKAMFSRRVQKYDVFLSYNDRFDLVKLAKNLQELKYEFLNEESLLADRYFLTFFETFYTFYSVHKNMDLSKALMQVLTHLNISAANKKITEGLDGVRERLKEFVRAEVDELFKRKRKDNIKIVK